MSDTIHVGTRKGLVTVSRRDGTKGDLLVTVEVVVPDSLSAEARQALDAYAQVAGAQNPRAKLFAAGS